MWELWSWGGALPFSELGEDEEVCEHVVHARGGLMRPERCPEGVFEVMSSCWERERGERPTYGRLLSDIARCAESVGGGGEIGCLKCGAGVGGWAAVPCGHEVFCRVCCEEAVGGSCLVCLRPIAKASQVVTTAALLGVGGAVSRDASATEEGEENEEEGGVTEPPSSGGGMINLEEMAGGTPPATGVLPQTAFPPAGEKVAAWKGITSTRRVVNLFGGEMASQSLGERVTDPPQSGCALAGEGEGGKEGGDAGGMQKRRSSLLQLSDGFIDLRPREDEGGGDEEVQ